MDDPNNGENMTNNAQPVRRAGRPKGSKNKPKLANVDHGQQDISVELVRVTREQREEYKTLLAEIHNDLNTIHHAFLRFSLNIKRIQEKRLYLCGQYTTFAEFFQREIGFGRHQAYHYIHAADILTNLLALGFPESDLPTKERICRALDKLEPDHLGKVWKLVLKYKDEGQDIDSNSVGKAAGELGIGGGAQDKDDADQDEEDEDGEEGDGEGREHERQLREEQQTEVLAQVKSASKKLKIGLTKETLTDDFRRRLTVELLAIAEMVKCLLTVVRFEEQQQAVPEAPQEWDGHEPFEAARAVMEEKQREGAPR
jgi:hypothetical protein